MLTTEEKKELERYCQKVIETLRPINYQWHNLDGGKIWCEDWEIIEILKYYFNGPEMYAEDPPPNRLKNNPMWSKEEIVQKAEALIKEVKSAEKIIEHFKKVRGVDHG